MRGMGNVGSTAFALQNHTKLHFVFIFFYSPPQSPFLPHAASWLESVATHAPTPPPVLREVKFFEKHCVGHWKPAHQKTQEPEYNGMNELNVIVKEGEREIGEKDCNRVRRAKGK